MKRIKLIAIDNLSGRWLVCVRLYIGDRLGYIYTTIVLVYLYQLYADSLYTRGYILGVYIGLYTVYNIYTYISITLIYTYILIYT